MNKKQLLRAGLFALSLGLSLSGVSHADCGGSDGSDCSQEENYGQFMESWIQEEPFNEFAGIEAQTVEVAENMDPGPSEEWASAGWGDFEPTAAAQPAQAYEVTENLTNGMTQVDGVEPTEAVMNQPGQTPNMTIVTSNVPDSGAGPLPSVPGPNLQLVGFISSPGWDGKIVDVPLPAGCDTSSDLNGPDCGGQQGMAPNVGLPMGGGAKAAEILLDETLGSNIATDAGYAIQGEIRGALKTFAAEYRRLLDAAMDPIYEASWKQGRLVSPDAWELAKQAAAEGAGNIAASQLATKQIAFTEDGLTAFIDYAKAQTP